MFRYHLSLISYLQKAFSNGITVYLHLNILYNREISLITTVDPDWLKLLRPVIFLEKTDLLFVSGVLLDIYMCISLIYII